MTPRPSRTPAGSAAPLGRRLADHAARLTPAERKVAHVVGTDPQLVAFGTVAEVAERAGASGASVVRLAAKLGYDGFVGLQATVRDELTDRLRPAAQRIREHPDADVVATTLAGSVDALHRTLGAVDPGAFDRVVALLADEGRAVWLLAGDAGDGLVRHAAAELGSLRPAVHVVDGNPVAVGRRLAACRRGDVVVALDVRRYDRWLLDAVRLAAEAGATVVALTDSPVSPLAAAAAVAFVVDAAGRGPFDDYAGALGLLTALVTGVARAGRRHATASLDRIEAAWAELGALED